MLASLANNFPHFSPGSIPKKGPEGQEIKQGERVGMIRFGSRADIYFENYDTLVKVNQKTIAGETLIAKKQ